MYESIHEKLIRLKLRGINSVLDEKLSAAEKEGAGAQALLEDLLNEECLIKDKTALRSRLKGSRMPWDWTLDTFPYDKQPAVNKGQIMDLRKLDFIERHENIVLIGPAGVGKTGLGIGLLREVIMSGKRGKFYNAQELFDELYSSLADQSTTKLINKLSKYPVLLVDEFGYLTITRQQSSMFFRLMEKRYHRNSTIITTNLDYPEWHKLFNDEPLVTALQDRLKDLCTTIYIDGESLRGKKSAKQPSIKKQHSEAENKKS